MSKLGTFDLAITSSSPVLVDLRHPGGLWVGSSCGDNVVSQSWNDSSDSLMSVKPEICLSLNWNGRLQTIPR